MGRIIFYIIAISIILAIVWYRHIDLFTDTEIEVIHNELINDEMIVDYFGEIEEITKVLPGSVKSVHNDKTKGRYRFLIKGELNEDTVTVKFYYERDSLVIDTILLK